MRLDILDVDPGSVSDNKAFYPCVHIICPEWRLQCTLTLKRSMSGKMLRCDCMPMAPMGTPWARYSPTCRL